MEVKLNAARNMAGNRLGDIQDRLSGLVERLDEIEVEIPGFDAIRVNQGAILERFDRMEGLVHRLASPDELFERDRGAEASDADGRLAARSGADRRADSAARRAARRAARGSERQATFCSGIESQLGALATEFAEARRQRKRTRPSSMNICRSFPRSSGTWLRPGARPTFRASRSGLSRIAAQVAEDRRDGSDTPRRLEQAARPPSPRRSRSRKARRGDPRKPCAQSRFARRCDRRAGCVRRAPRHREARPQARQGWRGTAAQPSICRAGRSGRSKARLDGMQAHIEELAKRDAGPARAAGADRKHRQPSGASEGPQHRSRAAERAVRPRRRGDARRSRRPLRAARAEDRGDGGSGRAFRPAGEEDCRDGLRSRRRIASRNSRGSSTRSAASSPPAASC